MANRDLLKEAIADAKALKETAIANAKAALEEAFEPRLKSMLSAKLEEMEKEEEVEEGYGKDKDDMKEETSEPHGNIGAQTPEGEPLGFLEEEDDTMDEEMNLDEILAELELDEEEGQDITEAEGVEEDIYEAEEDEKEEESEEPESEESEDEEAEGEEEEIDLEDMSEEDLKKFIEDVIEDMVEAGELEPGDQFEDDVDVDVDAEGELDIEDDSKTAVDENQQVDESMIVQAAEMLRDSGLVDPENAMAAAKAAIAAGASAPAIIGALASAVKDKMSKKKAANEGDIEEINELKSELHEVNLLNAKLLYSNKIFRAQNLQEAQKVKVLEAFDKAETVKEAKLVFETMSTNLTPVRTKKKQMVKENLGRASKATGVAPQTRSNIVDVDPQFARMQKLAGLR
jgi:hypothetical protein